MSIEHSTNGYVFFLQAAKAAKESKDNSNEDDTNDDTSEAPSSDDTSEPSKKRKVRTHNLFGYEILNSDMSFEFYKYRWPRFSVIYANFEA